MTIPAAGDFIIESTGHDESEVVLCCPDCDWTTQDRGYHQTIKAWIVEAAAHAATHDHALSEAPVTVNAWTR